MANRWDYLHRIDGLYEGGSVRPGSGLAVLHYPPQRGGQHSRKAPPKDTRKSKTLRGAPSPRARKPLPNLPRFACADLRCATPFPLPLRSRCKGGDTPRLAVATPRLRQEAFGMYMPRFNADVQEPEPQGEQP
jgi:hypothetical protein